MAINVVLKCSECATVQEATLTPAEKDIVCPSCGRRMTNLPPGDQAEIEIIQKKQRLHCIISLVLFFLTVVCLIWWIGGRADALPNKATGLRVEMNVAPLIGIAIFGIASLVLGILGSRKRFVVEF